MDCFKVQVDLERVETEAYRATLGLGEPMIEYHGWFTVRDSEGNVCFGGEIDDAVSLLRAGSNMVASQVVNAQHHVSVSGCRNHRGGEFDQVILAMNKIGTVASGSYGVLYWWDDEDPKHDNEFRVYVMRRGKIDVVRDELLSPCSPTLEGS